MKVILEYVWLDGNTVSDIRSLTKIVDVDIRRYDGVGTLFGKTPRIIDTMEEHIPILNINGGDIGLTKEITLLPVKLYTNPIRNGSYIVLCETYDGDIPHESNSRNALNFIIDDDKNIDISPFRQSFVLYKQNDIPVFYNENNCVIFNKNPYSLNNMGGEFIEKLIDCSNISGLSISRIENKNQRNEKWDYFTDSGKPLDIADDIIILRYLLYKIAPQFDLNVSYENGLFMEIITDKDRINDPYLLIKSKLKASLVE